MSPLIGSLASSGVVSCMDAIRHGIMMGYTSIGSINSRNRILTVSAEKTVPTEHPDVNLLFCANDMMALGAIQYLQGAGKTNVQVAGFDALAEAVKAIRDGKLQVTVDQNADQQGYLGVKYAVDLIQGKQPQLETFIDVNIITMENLP